jgi:hypothetical protein
VELANKKENQSRLTQQYAPGDQILITLNADERHSQPKMNALTKGPFTITQVHQIGTVTISCGNVTETINICRIKPFHTL